MTAQGVCNSWMANKADVVRSNMDIKALYKLMGLK